MMRVVVIGLDGADWRILDSLTKRKKLPFISEIKKNGIWGKCTCPIPPLTASSWSTFQTGVNPGIHGIFGFYNYRKNRLYNSNDIKAKRIWEYLSDTNKKSFIVNLPFSGNDIDGEVIGSFISLEENKISKETKRYLDKIKYENDFFQRDLKAFPQKRSNKVQKKKYLKRLTKLANMKLRLIEKKWRDKNYQFLFVLLRETDLAQHILFDDKLLDHFWHDVDIQMDRYLKPILNSKDSVLVLVSDHGFGKSGDLEFCPYPFIEENKNTKYKTNKNKIPSLNSQKARKYLAGIGLLKKVKYRLIERKRNAIKINKGYLVTPEGLYLWPKYNGRIEDVVKKLRSVKINDRNVFVKVEKSTDVYGGKHSKNGPDIVWMTREGITINTNPYATEYFSKRNIVLPGEHTSTPDGIYAISGRVVGKPKKQDIKLEELTPTLLAILNSNNKNNYLSKPINVGGKIFRDYVTKKVKEEIKNAR